jgi:hypothetical protein
MVVYRIERTKDIGFLLLLIAVPTADRVRFSGDGAEKKLDHTRWSLVLHEAINSEKV